MADIAGGLIASADNVTEETTTNREGPNEKNIPSDEPSEYEARRLSLEAPERKWNRITWFNSLNGIILGQHSHAHRAIATGNYQWTALCVNHRTEGSSWRGHRTSSARCVILMFVGEYMLGLRVSCLHIWHHSAVPNSCAISPCSFRTATLRRNYYTREILENNGASNLQQGHGSEHPQCR